MRKQTRNPEPDDCSRTSHSFRPPVHHAKYPSCVTCAAADGSTRDTSGSERACPGELPPWHGNLRDLPTYSVRYFPFPTKKSVDLFCSFTPIHYLCKCGDTQMSVTFRSLQKNLSIYFVVSLQSTTFASAEIRKLGKMSLLTSVNPQWGLTTANEHLGQGRPPTPPWVGFATLPAIAPHPLRQTSCRRLIH